MALSFAWHVYDMLQFARGANWTSLTTSDVPGTDLREKWIIISGSNNGVGLEAAKSFAAWGANLILACREPPEWERRPEDAVKECREIAREKGHTSIIEWWELDMASLANVEAFCSRWLQSNRVLDVLCNNAGIADRPVGIPILTTDGFEMIHQVRYSPDNEPRIVCTSSCTHYVGCFDPDHANGEPGMKGNYYPNNKLYLLMWVIEMQSRFLKHPEYLHITINAVHPGYVNTGIWVAVDEIEILWFSRIIQYLRPYTAITPQQGSLALTHAATSPEFGPDPSKQHIGSPNGRGGGKYINRIWEASPKSCCRDPDARAKLWSKVAEELHLHEKGLLDGLGF
ncbi:hypothetical protein F5Y15DRAFT_423902 [Xylariaceae sp. FL0016]|nr:hypothetical protein F5Y15DRAFT_423902 [Xylariaceae sp. FL0016]